MPDSEKPTLLVIDGHSLAFRAFHALPLESFRTRGGQHTNAIHGFLSMLLSLLRNEKPTHVAVAFDISRYSFRTREYPGYKATRGETPPEFIGQVPLLQQALAAMRITTISIEDYEADDILATLAASGSAGGYRVLVVSGDRDTIQLVNENVTLLYPASQGVSALTRYDPERVQERYGVRPEQYPDVAALVGETSDNLIGISKVGEKTAVKWLGQYGSLAGILEHADEIAGVVGNNLREQKENAIRNRRLNHLVTNLALPVELDQLERRPIDQDAVREVFTHLEFRTLLERVLKLEESSPESGAAAAAAPVSAATPPAAARLIDEELAQWLRRNSAADEPVAISIETVGEELTGLGLSTMTESVYVPWAPDRPDYTALEQWLAAESPKYLTDAKRQLKILARAGLPLGGIAVDTLLLAWLIDPVRPQKSLAEQVEQLLAEALPESDPNQLLPEAAALDPATTAWYVFRVARAALALLEPSLAAVLTDIELPLLPILAGMELAGIQVNGEDLSTLSSELAARAAEIEAEAFAVIGHEVNLGSPKQLQQVLFDELGLPATRAVKTGYSTDVAALTDLLEKTGHPFLELLMRHRDASKLRQITDTLSTAIAPDRRIHTTYLQTGTSTGRISSNDPNLQNIPIKTEVGRRIRAAFEAGTGYQSLLTADYSQLEMRIMAHLSGDTGLIEAFNSGEDLHRFVGARIFGVDPSEVTPVMRTKVKAMSYGLVYGLSAFGLSKQLRIDTAEARQLMTDYFERFGAVRDYLRSSVEQARIDGYTQTIFGRRRPFPDLHSGNRLLRENAERAALNAPIQGSAADIMKLAMIGVADDLSGRKLRSRMLLQVHDELVLEVAAGELAQVSAIVNERMRSAATLTVPLDVQIGTGANWDAAAH